jgi:hypothetical protein
VSRVIVPLHDLTTCSSNTVGSNSGNRVDTSRSVNKKVTVPVGAQPSPRSCRRESSSASTKSSSASYRHRCAARHAPPVAIVAQTLLQCVL